MVESWASRVDVPCRSVHNLGISIGCCEVARLTVPVYRGLAWWWLTDNALPFQLALIGR